MREEEEYSCRGNETYSSTSDAGGHISILMDEKTLNVNGNALGQGVLSSIDIIGRLRHYITSVSTCSQILPPCPFNQNLFQTIIYPNAVAM